MLKEKNNGGKQAKIGRYFFKEIEEIKDERLRSGKDKDRMSTEKITNLIARNEHWKNIKRAVISATNKEVKEYGLKE